MDQTSSKSRRVAFFGGSFDPPHLGHLAVARTARKVLSLDTVLFAPVGAQPLKPGGSSAPFRDRVAMTRLAIEDEPAFEVSLADAPHTGLPNYTIDTLLQVRAGMPAETELFCLMGADSFLTLRQWRRAAEIPFVATLIVAARPGQQLTNLAALLPPGLSLAPQSSEIAMPSEDGSHTLWSGILHNAAGDSARLYLLPGLHVEISASGVREQILHPGLARPTSAGSGPGSGSSLVPPAVLAYIEEHAPYR
jgi:nicotinate-nucleotide adenylyltransferase